MVEQFLAPKPNQIKMKLILDYYMFLFFLHIRMFTGHFFLFHIHRKHDSYSRPRHYEMSEYRYKLSSVNILTKSMFFC